jgi:hypothetical protein
MVPLVSRRYETPSSLSLVETPVLATSLSLVIQVRVQYQPAKGCYRYGSGSLACVVALWPPAPNPALAAE